MTLSLGKLTTVPINKIWKKEVKDFSPWLASEEGLALLGKTLGMNLKFDKLEQKVGIFRADIKCTNTHDSSIVVIENQLGTTDHVHLGKLLTYTAGLEAAYIIWIFPTYKNEHMATLDWLNKNTVPEICFFGLEIELWCIDELNPAPKFNIISKPNDWSPTQQKANKLTQYRQMKLNYWKGLEALAKQKALKLSFYTLTPERCDLCIDTRGVTLKAHIEPKNSIIGVGIRTDGENGRGYFDRLYEQKEAIEKDLGFKLKWVRGESRIRSKIWYFINGDIYDEKKWTKFQKWTIEHLEKMNSVFRLYLKDIKPSDWVKPDTDKEE